MSILLVTYAVKLVAATREPRKAGLPDHGRFILYGASPALHRHDRSRPGARLSARPRLCASCRCGGYRARCAAPPRHAVYEALAEASPPTSWSPTSCAAFTRRRKCWTAVSLQTPETILRRLDLKVARRLEGLLQATIAAPFAPGPGFGRLREYQYHDDVRHMDWNVTARCKFPMCANISKTGNHRWFLLDMSRPSNLNR